MVKLALHSIAYEAKTLNLTKAGYTAFYVDGKDGNDVHDGGSWGQAFKTIQHAIDEGEGWTTIYIRSLIHSDLNTNAASGQKNIIVDDGTDFFVGENVRIKDDNDSELNEIASISSNTLTMTTNLAHNYTTAADCVVNGIYQENVDIPKAKNGIKLIGDDEATTIVAVKTGTAILINSTLCEIENIQARTNVQYQPCVHLVGDNNKVTKCKIDGVVGLEIYGVYIQSNDNIVDGVTANQGGVYGVLAQTGYGDYSKIFNCFFDGCARGAHVDGDNMEVYDNTIKDCIVGIELASHSSKATIYHNNLVNNTTQVKDSGTNNSWMGNYYDDHTIDSDNDGICDTPYPFTTGSDYQPISRLNGWKQESIGSDSMRRVASGSKTLGTGVTKYLSIDSGTNGAEIIGILIKGVVGADWTLDVYVPTADAVAAPAAGDKRDTNAYVLADIEGGMLEGFAIPYNCFLDFTNDSAGDDNIDEVVVMYRSASTLTLTWET